MVSIEVEGATSREIERDEGSVVSGVAVPRESGGGNALITGASTAVVGALLIDPAALVGLELWTSWSMS
jgi:hypothetical protein